MSKSSEPSINTFCAAIRRRTEDHASAAKLVRNIPGQMISICRQELDSLIRVVYLLSISDLAVRHQLIEQTLANQPWSIKNQNGKMKKITDREMVELASELFGWTQSVYKFGCAFIHLSGLHGESNPLGKLNNEDRMSILMHMRHYHGGPVSDGPTLEEFGNYLPKVLEKISGNLECYLKHLEKNETPSKSQI